MSDVIERATYRNRWADAYRRMVDLDPERGGRFERVRVASAESFDRGERLTDMEIAHRVEQLTRPGDQRGTDR
jgi:hypothetical protein